MALLERVGLNFPRVTEKKFKQWFPTLLQYISSFFFAPIAVDLCLDVRLFVGIRHHDELGGFCAGPSFGLNVRSKFRYVVESGMKEPGVSQHSRPLAPVRANLPYDQVTLLDIHSLFQDLRAHDAIESSTPERFQGGVQPLSLPGSSFEGILVKQAQIKGKVKPGQT